MYDTARNALQVPQSTILHTEMVKLRSMVEKTNAARDGGKCPSFVLSIMSQDCTKQLKIVARLQRNAAAAAWN